MFTINISGRVPSINHMYMRFMKNGRVITTLTKDGAKFKKGLKDAILEQNQSIMEGHLKINLTLIFPDNLRRDVDNYSKSLLDCLTGTIIKDDSQIQELHIFKRIEKGVAKAIIEISECS
jgi:Holliday junction resolvase RusA-like endonuclease